MKTQQTNTTVYHQCQFHYHTYQGKPEPPEPEKKEKASWSTRKEQLEFLMTALDFLNKINWWSIPMVAALYEFLM